MQTFVAGRFEGYPVRHARHEIATLGKELQLRLGRRLVYLREAAQGAKRHLVEEVARLLGLVEDGKDAAIQLLVVLIVFPRHPLVEEPELGYLVVRVLRESPVELPARVGPQLVVAAVERVLQDEAPMHLAVLQFKLLALHEVAVLIEQLSVKHAAQPAWRPRIAAADVGLVINGIAQEITCVVHVDEDLFLRDSLAECLQPLSPALERRGSRCLLR